MSTAPILLALLASAIARAEPGERPLIDLEVGPYASVTMLPVVNEHYEEFLLRDAQGDLEDVLTRRSAGALRYVDADIRGPGTWFVRIALADSSSDIDVVIADGHLVVRAVPTARPLSSVGAAPPTLDELLGDACAERGTRDQPLVLTFLGGDGLAGAMAPDDHRRVFLRSPDWLGPSSWASIDEQRLQMLEATDSGAAAQARFRLGLHTLDFGFAREAWYYLGGLSPRNTGLRPLDVVMAQARAAIATRRWVEARTLLARASALGAEQGAVIEGLALVSLATGHPARAPAGRALAAQTANPDALLLAAELLQREGYYSESLPLLVAARSAYGDWAPPLLCLRLGDVYLVQGEHDLAQRSWECADFDVSSVRRLLGALLEADPATWPESVPYLVQKASQRSTGGAEALYLLAQIDSLVGAYADAISELGALMQRFPDKSVGSDVPERFWRVYRRYVGPLYKQGQWYRIAAVHETTWDPLVMRAVDETDELVMVAMAYEEVGLPERAIRILRDAVAIEAEGGGDDRDHLVHLARLYAETGDFEDGLATLAYLRRRGVPTEELGGLYMLEARFAELAGDADGVARALRNAAQFEEFRDVATLRLAVSDAEAGRCRSAVPTLKRSLFGPKGDQLVQESGPWLALARCLVVQGDSEGAAVAARRAAGLAQSQDESRYAMWLAAVSEGWRDATMVDALLAGEDVWAAMAREQRDAEAFARDLESFRRPGRAVTAPAGR